MHEPQSSPDGLGTPAGKSGLGDAPEPIDLLLAPTVAVRRTPGADSAEACAALADRPSTPTPIIPGYEVLGQLGRGGMGIVYRANQLALNRIIALKLLPSSIVTDPDLLARFRGEAEAIARLQHPNIIQVYEVGACEDGPYFVMEFAEGGSLAEVWKGSPQDVCGSAELVATLAEAIHAAHERGVVHRDLKPSNILLAVGGVPKISDFG